jgi:hypothetical protein
VALLYTFSAELSMILRTNLPFSALKKVKRVSGLAI